MRVKANETDIHQALASIIRNKAILAGYHVEAVEITFKHIYPVFIDDDSAEEHILEYVLWTDEGCLDGEVDLISGDIYLYTDYESMTTSFIYL